MDTGSCRTCVLLVTVLTLSMNGVLSVYVCEKPADVVFVLDISNSIWRPDFERQKAFVRQIINRFTVGEDNMRVGAVAFADFPRLQFHLNRFYDKRDIKQAIGRMHQHGGIYTFTADAIRYMNKRSFRYQNGMRDNSTKIGIIITDGRSYDTATTGREAQKARDQGIHLFAIGVGDKVDQNELDVIASHPTKDYSFMVENYTKLKYIQDLLAEKACTVTDPPTTTTTTTTTPMPTTTTTTTTTTIAPTTTTTTTTTPPPTFPPIRFITPSPELPVYPLPVTDENNNPQEFKGIPDIYVFPDGIGEDPDAVDVTDVKKGWQDLHPNQIGNGGNPDAPDDGHVVVTSVGQPEQDGVVGGHGDGNGGLPEHPTDEVNSGGPDGEDTLGGGDVNAGDGGDGDGRDGDGNDDRTGLGPFNSNVIIHTPEGTGVVPGVDDGQNGDLLNPNGDIASPLTNVIKGKSRTHGNDVTGGDADKNRSKPQKKHDKNRTNKYRYPTSRHGKDPDYLTVQFKGNGCGPQQPTDIVFVVDSKSGSDAYQRYLWNFVRDVTSRLDMKDDMFRVQFVHECVSVPDISLDAFTDKSMLMGELNNVIDSPRRTASLLRSMSGKLTAIQSPFDDRRKVGIYITDGHSLDPEDTTVAAREAKEQYGADMYVVGVGGKINPMELRNMVSRVDSKHLYMMSHHMKLPKVAKHLAKQMCIKNRTRKLKLKHRR